jgi:hypothetical protein
MRFGRVGGTAIVIGVAALAAAVPALAFDCHVANKPTGAGSAVTVSADTGNVISVNKPNPGTEEHIHGGFITVDLGDAGQFDTFAHAPQGVLPPVREGGAQDNCDGKGLDAIHVCLGAAG